MKIHKEIKKHQNKKTDVRYSKREYKNIKLAIKSSLKWKLNERFKKVKDKV